MAIQFGRLGSAIVCAFAFAGTASAADLRVPPVAPPPAFNWSGCYVGGYLGGAWLDAIRHLLISATRHFDPFPAASLLEESRTVIPGMSA